MMKPRIFQRAVLIHSVSRHPGPQRTVNRRLIPERDGARDPEAWRFRPKPLKDFPEGPRPRSPRGRQHADMHLPAHGILREEYEHAAQNLSVKSEHVPDAFMQNRGPLLRVAGQIVADPGPDFGVS